MKKSYKIIIVCLIALLFLYSLYLALSSKKAAAPSAGSQASQGTLSVPSQNGTPVQVNDFTKTPARVVGDTMVISENPNYSTVYFTKDQSFLITILAEPVAQNRTAAEADLLSKLKIGQAAACSLTISLSVPAYVDPNLAGQNYGLSFCPTGVEFPQ